VFGTAAAEVEVLSLRTHVRVRVRHFASQWERWGITPSRSRRRGVAPFVPVSLPRLAMSDEVRLWN